MKRTYHIKHDSFCPIAYTEDKKTIYLSPELFIALYKATPEAVHEAQDVFSKELGTTDFQIVCLEKDDTSQYISDFVEKEVPVKVPVERIFKVGG